MSSARENSGQGSPRSRPPKNPRFSLKTKGKQQQGEEHQEALEKRKTNSGSRRRGAPTSDASRSKLQWYLFHPPRALPAVSPY